MRFFLTLLSIVSASFYNVAVSAVTSTTEKTIPSLSNEPIGVSNYIQMFFGLFIIIILIVGMAWLMRRMGSMGGMSVSNLKVLGGISVGQRERVVLVQAGDTQLLVGVAPGSIRTLHVMEEPITVQTGSVETASKISSGFAEKLHAAIKNRGIHECHEYFETYEC